MKKVRYIFLCLFLCCAFIPKSKALTIGVVDVSSALTVRETASQLADATELGFLADNSVVEILETIDLEALPEIDLASQFLKWYKISYNGGFGYIASNYVRISSTSYDYATELAKFPTDYQTKIAFLHELYPYAIFVRKDTGLNFSTVVNGEYTSNGRSLISDCSSGTCSRDGYKSTDSWSYNYYTNVFEDDFAGNNWYAANKATIGYYLDPRNFIKTNSIFMFLSLSYDSNNHNLAGLNYVLKDTFMDNTAVDITGKTYAEVFIDAAVQSSANPYFLAARIIQEQGTGGTSPLISGTYSGYEGYYNYFNINAYGSTNTEVIVNGLKYAKEKGWNTIEKSIIGGAKFIGSGYINVGQDSLYLQKWHVFPIPNWSLYSHQYMQNIQAPSSESTRIYNTYYESGLLNSSILIFEIPVYNSMPETASLPSSKNPNNYLKTLTVDGTSVPSFDGANGSYTVHVASNLTKVTLGATKVYSGATVSNLGDITLTSDEQNIDVIVTAANGATKTYTVKVIKDKIPDSINTILTGLNYTNDGTNLLNMKSLVDPTTLISNIKKDSEIITVNIIDKDSQVKATGYMATGDTITINDGVNTATLNVVVPGDLNGDGLINSGDLLRMRQQLIGLVKLSGVYNMSADIANDDKIINSGDLLRLRQHLIGIKEIGE